MENELFASMRAQLCPSGGAKSALQDKLEQITVPRRRRPMWGGLAAAACAVFAISLYYTLPFVAEGRLHSYITLEDGDPAAVKEEYQQETTAQGLDKGGEEEEEPNTGDLPGGAYIGEVPVQLGADAYQLLMDHFGGTRPDWYGGAYFTDRGSLMVLLVEDQDPGDKTLELEVLEAVGDLPVGFTSAKYSRNDLERMNGELLKLLDGKGIPATWGIYDDQNRIVLDVSEPLPDDLLSAIAKIDPDDDAILIRVIEGQTTVTQDLMKGPAPMGESVDPVPGGVTVPDVDAVDPEEGEDPAPHFATEDPNDTPVPDEDLEAIEPYYDGGIRELPDKLPGKVESAHQDLPPVEEK